MTLFKVGIGSYCPHSDSKNLSKKSTSGGIFTFGEETKVEAKDIVTWKYVFGMGLGLGLAFGYHFPRHK